MTRRLPSWAPLLALTIAIVVALSVGAPPTALAAVDRSPQSDEATDQTPLDGPTLLFVHGINAKFNDAGFRALLEPLELEYPGRVKAFVYYQDLAWATAEGCDIENARPLPSPDAPTGGMPVNQIGIGTDTCDSQSDLALNAVALHGDVKDIFDLTGKPVVLVANSMGAPIVRGFLSYSYELGDTVATTMVDSLVFMEGAHDGSHYAPLAALGLHLLLFGQDVFLQNNGPRPAMFGLMPGSTFYDWANPGEARLPDLPTFNVYGDIAFQRETCPPLWFLGDCEYVREEEGDNFILPGSNDPFDSWPNGGAKFLRPGQNDGQQWQWPIGGPDHVYKPFSFLEERPKALAAANPAGHARLGWTNAEDVENMTLLNVEDCDTHAQVSLDVELLRIIRGRMDGEPYPCDVVQGG